MTCLTSTSTPAGDVASAPAPAVKPAMPQAATSVAPAAPAIGRGRRMLADLFAGSFTAVVFYAEYMGMGVVLAGALPVAGAVSLGMTMVVGAVLVNCLLGAFLRQPLLAGPRAASLAVLVAGMKFATDHVGVAADRMPVAMAAMAAMLVVAAAVQMAGTLPRVRAWLACTSVALRKGFVFSTAVGIVVGLGSAQLDGCLRVSPGLTLLVLSSSVAVALSWSSWCNAPGSGSARRSMAPFALIIGCVMASTGYFGLVAPSVHDGLCGAVGMGLPEGTVMPQGVTTVTLMVALRSLPWWVCFTVVVMGGLLGLTLLLESLTALRESRARTAPAMWAAQLKLRALANVVSAPLGLACSSLSMTRTNALIETAGSTRFALLFHGVALVVILVFLREWLNVLPQLAVAVALLLLAIQMIDDETRTQVWRVGYHAGAAPDKVRCTWKFWGVVAFSLSVGSVLHHQGWGFGGGPVIALCAGMAWTGQRFLIRRRELRQTRQLVR